VNELQSAGFDSAELCQAGFEAHELKSAGVPAPVARRAGYSTEQLRKGAFTASEMKDCGCNVQQLKTAGFSSGDLKGASFDAALILSAGYSLSEMRASGFTASDLKAAGRSSQELKVAGFSVNELQSAGFDSAELCQAEFEARALRTAGFTSLQLRHAGYSPQQLCIGGFSAANLKSIHCDHFDKQAIITAGYGVAQLRRAGYTEEEVIQSKKFSYKQIAGGGFFRWWYFTLGRLPAFAYLLPCTVRNPVISLPSYFSLLFLDFVYHLDHYQCASWSAYSKKNVFVGSVILLFLPLICLDIAFNLFMFILFFIRRVRELFLDEEQSIETCLLGPRKQSIQIPDSWPLTPTRTHTIVFSTGHELVITENNCIVSSSSRLPSNLHTTIE
jgi:hypothetical protein